MATRPYLIPIPRSRRLSRTCRLRERRPDQSIRHLCPSATRPHGPSLWIRRCTTPHPTRRPCELNAKQNLPRREGQRKVLVASLLDDGRGRRRYQMGVPPERGNQCRVLAPGIRWRSRRFHLFSIGSLSPSQCGYRRDTVRIGLKLSDLPRDDKRPHASRSRSRSWRPSSRSPSTSVSAGERFRFWLRRPAPHVRGMRGSNTWACWVGPQ
jgi:hypothetical protein